jgi:hypothetical protein
LKTFTPEYYPALHAPINRLCHSSDPAAAPNLTPPAQEILLLVPFTLSHAAAAIPFRRARLVMSALVIGCFAPDCVYLVSLRPHGRFGHTLPGVFLLDLPGSLLALWLFHAFVKPPLLFFLPGGIRRRLKEDGANGFSFRPVSRLALIVLSVLVGIATHIAWDFFTHDNDWPYQHWAILRGRVHLPIAGPEPLIKMLEYGSTLLGLAILAIWIWHWYRTTEPSPPPGAELASRSDHRTITVLLPLAAILCGALRAYPARGVSLHWRSMLHFITDTLIASIGLFLVGLLLYGVLLRLESARREPV